MLLTPPLIPPHGGGIEPGTTEIADAVAGNQHIFYSFEGLKDKGNLDLHITSRHFDEPVAIRIAENSDTILALHGCEGNEKVVYIGGRDEILKKRARDALESANILVIESPRFSGKSPLNSL